MKKGKNGPAGHRKEGAGSLGREDAAGGGGATKKQPMILRGADRSVCATKGEDWEEKADG